MAVAGTVCLALKRVIAHPCRALCRFPLSIAVLLGVPSFLPAQVSDTPVAVNPGTITRGGVLSVSVSNAPLNPRETEIRLNGHVLPAVLQPPTQAGLATAETFRATIPDTLDPTDKAFLPLGEYRVTAVVDKRPFPSDAKVNVISPAQMPPVLTSISPAVFISSGAGAHLTLNGSGFAERPAADNTILIRSRPVPVVWDGCDRPDLWTDTQSVHGKVEIEGKRIVLCNISVPDEAAVGISVRQGTLASEEVKLVLSPWGTGTIVFFSFLVDLIGAALILFLASTIRKYTINGEHYGLFRILFLDPETNSYSLSKYQFYLWTAAALFAYTYLAISRMLVQHLLLPDVPGSLPGIIGIGAGTAVGAQIVTAVRGPKGAGSEKPSLGDFITSGGVAAPERVQMFLWTNLAVLAFCVATLRYSPWEISTLPDIGSGLLLLSGLSSVGYLGGKLARKPGPVLSEISISPAWPEAPSTAAVPARPADGLANSPADGLADGTAAPANLAQPIAEAEAALRAAETQLLSSTTASPALYAATSPQALAGARAAVKALRDALTAAKGGASLSALGNLAVDADAASQLAAAAFSELLNAAPPVQAKWAPVNQAPVNQAPVNRAQLNPAQANPSDSPALESSRGLAELAEQCAAATQTLATGASLAVGATQAIAPTVSGPAVRTIVLRGRNLSTEATFEINNMELPFRMLNPVNGVRGPERVTPEEDRSLTNMGREIRLNMAAGDMETSDRANYDKWFSARATCLRLLIVNPDGQTAEISFGVPPGSSQKSS